MGEIKLILTCGESGEGLSENEAVNLVAGCGIEGDRYYSKTGTFSKALEESEDFEVTLIEMEEIDAFNQAVGIVHPPGEFRRNLVTTGIRLNDLVEKEFTIGPTRLYGVRLCEPCKYLERFVGEEVTSLMLHKAGLRAAIRIGGAIRVGNTIEEC